MYNKVATPTPSLPNPSQANKEHPRLALSHDTRSIHFTLTPLALFPSPQNLGPQRFIELYNHVTVDLCIISHFFSPQLGALEDYSSSHHHILTKIMGGSSTVASETSSQRPRRQSCDRCHTQKVRCTRSENRKTGQCDRCLRKGSQCVYSSCLPKGRPSLYRVSETSSNSKAHSAPSLSPAISSPDRSSAQADVPDPPIQDTMAVSPADVLGEHDTEHDADVDMDIHGEHFSALPCSTGSFDDFCTNWWPGAHLDANVLPEKLGSEFHLDPALNSAQPFSNMEFPAHISGMPEAVSTDSSSSASRIDSHQQSLDWEAIQGTSRRTSRNSRTSSHSSRSSRSRADKDAIEHCISQLSRLSTHSSQLLCFSRNFLGDALDSQPSSKAQDSAVRAQQGIKSVFKSINSWLVRGCANTDPTPSFNLGSTNSSELLHYVFSASNHLLEILRQIRTASKASTPTSAATAFPSPASIGAASRAESSGASAPEEEQDYSIVRHLVLVCATLLLNMYIAALVALQRSSDVINSSLRKHESLDEPNEHMDAASRAHMQLVSVVQLCSYFIRRQNQTLDTMMANCKTASHRRVQRDQNSRQVVSFDAMSELETEVEGRLRHLQQSLYIV